MRKEFARLVTEVARAREKYARLSDIAMRASCEDMVTAAAESTPPLNGENRGKNTVTGNLAAHWDYSISTHGDGTRITLTNDLSYASYVDQGHRMDVHFVPWLYIDGTGVIARHIPVPGEKLFGLVVGTRTPEVRGYHMADKARERFFRSYTAAHDNIVRTIEEELNGD